MHPRLLPRPTLPASPVSATEVAATRQPLDRASQLPPRVFHDPEVLAWEQQAWFGRDWIQACREEDVPEPGAYLLVDLAGENVIVVRADDGRVRAFHNVCRHRGSSILDAPSGRIPRFQCPYHAWTYTLDGRLRRAAHTERIEGFLAEEQGLVEVRLETWAGFVFLSLDADAPPLLEHLGDLPPLLAHVPIERLRRAHRREYDVRANWKIIGENYSECLHCPGVHPQLNRLTPYDQGHNHESNGPWAGGWMELVDGSETMSVDGLTHGRRPLPGIGPAEQRRITYLLVWPNLLLSLHPDYLMTHQVWPVAPDRSRVVCDWLFDPEAMAEPGFDPSDAIEFWDLTNRQDWAVCEGQQRGSGSRAYTPGRYTLMEDMVHAFDLMVADGYAGDGVRTRFGPRHDKWSPARRRGSAVTRAAS